jgi:hypothetical protein
MKSSSDSFLSPASQWATLRVAVMWLCGAVALVAGLGACQAQSNSAGSCRVSRKLQTNYQAVRL